jgi:hypothetical protein
MPKLVSPQVIAQFAAAVGMAQFAQRFAFDLPDALSGDVEALAHFFQRMALPIF